MVNSTQQTHASVCSSDVRIEGDQTAIDLDTQHVRHVLGDATLDVSARELRFAKLLGIVRHTKVHEQKVQITVCVALGTGCVAMRCVCITMYSAHTDGQRVEASLLGLLLSRLLGSTLGLLLGH